MVWVHGGNCSEQPPSVQLITFDPSECMQAQNEVAVLALLDHPNVVKYYECFAEQGTKVKIVMELCEVRCEPSPQSPKKPSHEEMSVVQRSCCRICNTLNVLTGQSSCVCLISYQHMSRISESGECRACIDVGHFACPTSAGLSDIASCAS